ncbi:MAG TPA: tRNA (adenosine(37)-N6)-threonylcarbamoyltransferase complex ATPase subunit type 1 TsaE [Anaerolineales bacterium]|nr:tRNA (adenosine(37)-N6)-threonylcarbamoyltransferase complex ATPase subunit type 1 TsaE [Anaerolineales bacterium]
MPVISSNSLEFISLSAEQTTRLGMRLGKIIQAGMLICLAGELGSGKTTFVKGLAAGWGSFDTVLSPTFQLVNEYTSPDHKKLFHLDTYRLESLLEAEELDIDNMLNYGAVAVEWADKIEEILPIKRLWVQLDHLDETRRTMIFSAIGDEYQNLLEKFRKMSFAR